MPPKIQLAPLCLTWISKSLNPGEVVDDEWG